MTLQGSVTRRNFLGTGVAAATAAIAGAQSPRPETAAFLPRAIAALPVLSGQTRPFTVAERQARIEKAKSLMADALFYWMALAADRYLVSRSLFVARFENCLSQTSLNLARLLRFISSWFSNTPTPVFGTFHRSY